MYIYILLYYVMLCYVMLCYVMLCYVMLYPSRYRHPREENAMSSKNKQTRKWYKLAFNLVRFSIISENILFLFPCLCSLLTSIQCSVLFVCFVLVFGFGCCCGGGGVCGFFWGVCCCWGGEGWEAFGVFYINRVCLFVLFSFLFVVILFLCFLFWFGLVLI